MYNGLILSGTGLDEGPKCRDVRQVVPSTNGFDSINKSPAEQGTHTKPTLDVTW